MRIELKELDRIPTSIALTEIFEELRRQGKFDLDDYSSAALLELLEKAGLLANLG